MATSRPRPAPRRRTRGPLLVLLALMLTVLGLPYLAASPAVAAPNSLQIDKVVNNAAPERGETFTYTIVINCVEEDCLDTQIVDELPDGLTGFPIVSANVSPSSLPATVTWQPGGASTPPATVTDDTSITVDLDQPTSTPVGTGLQAGQTYTVQLTLQVPADYPPGTSPEIVNEASVSASNADTKTDDVAVVIESEVDLGVEVDKSWNPAQQDFDEGAASTIGVDATNTSNVPVDSITIQEPKAAADGAAELDPSNPFVIKDFTGFSGVDIPEGCTQVQVDAYVFDPVTSTWSWQEGNPRSPALPLALPAGVTNDEVGGVRVTCTGEMDPDETLSFDVGLAQRADDRNDGTDLSLETQTVDNVATGTVEYDGEESEPDDGEASHQVDPLIPEVSALKDIAPANITAGESTTASITATNGDTDVVEMTVSDLDFFTEEVTFGGWTGPLTWPADATSAEITYYDLDGNPIVPSVPAVEGLPPADPTEPISGFTITYSGPIDANESGGGSFDIDTSEEAALGGESVTLTNTVDTTVEAENGLEDDASFDADLTIINPDIDAVIEKSVLPSTTVEPGDTVIAGLETTAGATGNGAYVDSIVVEDSLDNWTGDPCAAFWNAFDVTAIAPTQVPADTVLTIEVQDESGTWHELEVYGPNGAATVFQMSEAEFDAALAALAPPLTTDDVVGIRFTFDSTRATGFPASETVTPNVVFTARDDLRDDACPDPTLDTPVDYGNTATTDATGETAGGRDLDADDEDTDGGTIVYPDGGPGDGVDIDKDWTLAAVDAQSGERPRTHLDWHVGGGYNPVTITDMAGDPATTDVEDTVFDAFDLIRIEAIDPDDAPFSNGWYLKYDSVTQVELYDGTGWVTVPGPDGSWMTGDRGFKGYQTTVAERASTVAVRITLEETSDDTDARVLAQQTGAAFDPYAPEPGSGVGSGAADRRFDLTWELRDVKRSDGSFVVADELYNTADEGIVNNSVAVTGTPTTGPDVTVTDDDTIQILDPDPAVEVAKDVTPTEDVYTPPVGTDADEYPTVTWSISGHNASTARASYVRITDPATCDDLSLVDCQTAGTAAAAVANPFTTDGSVNYLSSEALPNPFQRFDARQITIGASIADEVDLAASVVWLLRYNAGTYSVAEHTVPEVNAMGPGDLTDVAGISVTFEGIDPVTGVGTITQDNDLTIEILTRLRATLRSNDASFVLEAGQTYDQVNRVMAQSYDPVAADGELDGDVDDATTQLTGGIVNITPMKSIDPATITEPEHDAGNDQATVTVGADQGTDPRSTLSPNRVIVEDQADSAEFWNAFDFAGNVVITQMPNGADQVQVDLFDGTTWEEGTPGSATTFVLPSVPNAQVQGIRFTFDRVDGGLFSTTLPAPNWTATATYDVDLRDAYRAGGGEIEFPSTVTNVQSSNSERDVDDNDSEIVDEDATVTLDPGTHELAVNKLTNGGTRIASAGDNVPFELTLENTGTGYLTMTELRDTLPPELVFTGDPAPEFTADPDGSLSEDVTVTTDGDDVVFTWPDGGDVMEPGEVFQITVYLELQPGLGAGDRATNTMVATTDEALDSCTNTEAGGTTTGDFGTDPTTCGTTDYIESIAGPNLFTAKGVIGSLDGAYNPNNADAICNATLSVGGSDYYRNPCVAHSQVGGTDDWVLHNVNSGTITIDEMWIADQLPVEGDRLILSGGPRNSDYRPRLVADSLQVDAPAGTTQVVEVTTSPDVCVNTAATITTQPPCEQNGEVWEPVDASTDWDGVSGIRVYLDFTTTDAGALQPGEAADVTYSSTNELDTDADDSGSSRVVPVADQFANNQYGVKYLFTGVAEHRATAPGVVGVHLRTGSIEVVKEVTGPADRYAPDEFLVDVTCAVGAEELDLGPDAVVELNEGNDYTVRISGIPVSEQGTSCTVAEQGAVGEFGETSRTGTPTTLDVVVPDDEVAPGDVPTAQIATIVNDYQWTGLSVTKRVDTEAVDTEFGPFEFTLSCVTSTGEDVVLAPIGQTEITFEIAADETWTAPADRIPVGAECTLTETEADAADGLVFTGDNVVDNGDGSATVTPGEDPAEVEVTNAFDAGTFTLAKETDGDGAALYGTGVFTFDVVCTYQDQTPYDEQVELRGGETLTVGPFAVGTECTVAETGTGGATEVVLDPADGVVVIPSPTAPDPTSSVTLTATNTFDLTSLEVEKVVTGLLTAPGANGPFTVSLECTWLIDGERVAFEVPGGAERVLRAGNDYRASYERLPSSAECTLTETDDGGAESTVVLAKVAGEKVTETGTSITVDLSETDGPGEAGIIVRNRFVDGGINPGGDKDGDGLPDTGARFGFGLLGLAVLFVIAGIAALIANRRRSMTV